MVGSNMLILLLYRILKTTNSDDYCIETNSDDYYIECLRIEYYITV